MLTQGEGKSCSKLAVGTDLKAGIDFQKVELGSVLIHQKLNGACAAILGSRAQPPRSRNQLLPQTVLCSDRKHTSPQKELQEPLTMSARIGSFYLCCATDPI